jgi:hypothetical protein
MVGAHTLIIIISQQRSIVMPVRKIFSPEMLADGKLRYERGDLVEDIAADWKSHPHTVVRTAKRLGWVRNRTRPPQELSAARRLQRQLELAPLSGGLGAPVDIAPPGLGERPQPRGERPQPRGERPQPPPEPPQPPGEPPARRETAPQTPLPEPQPDTPLALLATDQVERSVLTQLAEIEAMRARLGPQAQTPAEAHHTARALATLTQTLQRLQELRSPAPRPQPGSYDDDDDMPRDIDEFRNELARRMRLLVQSRYGGDFCGPAEPADASPAGE